MAIDPQKFAAPATKGDVAGLAISVAISLSSISGALKALATEQDALPAVTEIHERIKELHEMFDDLIGEG